jgi:hypothetical protein
MHGAQMWTPVWAEVVPQYLRLATQPNPIMTNTDDTASSWRDLADQLRPDEIMRLDQQERSGETEAWLLGAARALARENLADVMFGHVADPPDAETLFGWQTGDDGVSFREFKGGQAGSAAWRF